MTTHLLSLPPHKLHKREILAVNWHDHQTQTFARDWNAPLHDLIFLKPPDMIGYLLVPATLHPFAGLTPSHDDAPIHVAAFRFPPEAAHSAIKRLLMAHGLASKEDVILHVEPSAPRYSVSDHIAELYAAAKRASALAVRTLNSAQGAYAKATSGWKTR